MAGQSSSNSNAAQVPSWDEFNLAHDDADNKLEDYNEINEPGQPEELGPSLPPGFGGDEILLHDNAQPSNNGLLSNDFSIPPETEQYDYLDDPEDPLQGSSSNSSFTQKRVVGPQIPSTFLPKILQQNKANVADEHFALPALGSASLDFIPGDQPCTSNTCVTQNSSSESERNLIGPALPPEFLITAPSNLSGPEELEQQKAAAIPTVDELLDDIGPTLPPDEPQQSCSSALFSNNNNGCINNNNIAGASSNHQRRSQERIGPTLPCSSDEEEEEDQEEDQDENTADDEEDSKETEGEPNGKRTIFSSNVKVVEDESEELLIGPMPPAPEKTEEEAQIEYLTRLAQFEANKTQVSNGLKREEWMLELPQKMLKTGAFGLTAKTSFSRSSAGPSTSADQSAWTSVPNAANGDGQRKNNLNGPSSSRAVKRAEQDEWEEQRANELNKNRSESLMDAHQKKRRLESGSNDPSGKLLYTNSGERRPFNRDTDIEVSGMGSAGGVGGLKERMGDLSNRFGHSNERKFL